MSSPDLGQAELDAVIEVVRSGALSIGRRVEEFEARCADVAGVPHAIAVSSGTAGLHLAILAAGVQPDDVVITTPFSFVASANVILYERAIPRFVDVEPETGNIDAALVGAAADEVGERLRAILPVHVFGEVCDMPAITATAQGFGVPVIEDACEAIGATRDGRPAGSFGDAAVFAFYPNKQVATGEGGMLLTPRDDWAALFRSLRNQGRDVHDAWLRHSRLGYNYRLDEMSAALGAVQLGRLGELLRRRAQVAAWYHERLQGIPGVTLPPHPKDSERSWFVYVVRLDDAVDRDAVMRALEQRGIPSRPYFEPIHLQPFYRERFGLEPGMFPVAEHLGRTSLALPFSGVHTEAQIDQVSDGLRKVLADQG